MIGFDTLYSWVRELPIVDWHNHLDLAVLAENKPLGSLYEVWVKADPYKHRARKDKAHGFVIGFVAVAR